MKFEQLNIIPPILRAVSDEGYTVPSPIQEKAIPPALEGRDVLGCAQTGTGKTAAFAIPILQRLSIAATVPAASPAPAMHAIPVPPRASGNNRASVSPRPQRVIRALVLTPTRELALQISDSFKSYGHYLRLKTTVIFGGVPQNPQVDDLRRGIDILVATPGRLNDLINQGYVDLRHVQTFVLDEADRMLDMGFIHDVEKIIARIPAERQTLFFSATMPASITNLCNRILNDPVRVAVTPISSPVDVIDQQLYYVDKLNKRLLLVDLLKKPDVVSALVFTFTKHGADRVVRELENAGVEAQAIHGNKSQNARQRALNAFKTGRIKVLVATDIAARGIDIDQLSHVINYDLPNIPETYVHRIGRTARAGLSGTAISFCSIEQMDELRDIEKLIEKRIPVVEEHAYPMKIMVAPPKAARPGRPPQSRSGHMGDSFAGKGRPRAPRASAREAAPSGKSRESAPSGKSRGGYNSRGHGSHKGK